MKRQCVGVDIANQDFKVALAKKGADDSLSCTTFKRFANTKTGFNQLVRWATSEMDKDVPVIFLMEPADTHVWNKKVHGLITNGISMYSPWHAVWKD